MATNENSNVLFSETIPLFKGIIPKASNITHHFISPRRWRKRFLEEFHSFLSTKNSNLLVFLPNFKNKIIIDSLKNKFDEGKPYRLNQGCGKIL